MDNEEWIIINNDFIGYELKHNNNNNINRRER